MILSTLKTAYIQAYLQIKKNPETTLIAGVASHLFSMFDSTFIFFGIYAHQELEKKYTGPTWFLLAVKNLILHLCTGILIGIGFLFLIIPGVYLYTRWAFVTYILIEQNCSMRQALFISKQLTRTRWSWFWIFSVHALLCITVFIMLVALVTFSSMRGHILFTIPAMFFSSTAFCLLLLFNKQVNIQLYLLAKESYKQDNALLDHYLS